jgi:2-keto-4-pentenoate hydratase/2-oxohepta-3-ene-1,7-dioic acid hydratase in catechol pathway
MRLLSYSLDSSLDRQPRWGLVDRSGTGVVDLGSRITDVADLQTLVTSGRTAEAATHLNEVADHALDEVTFERPLAWPRKVFCIGVNYGGRAAEYLDPSDASYPSVFVRFPDSFTGHDRALIRPPESPQLDYEGEIVAVVGRGGRRIPVADAPDHLLGLTLGNEGTIRDWVRHAKFNVTQGKNWEATGAIGPWITCFTAANAGGVAGEAGRGNGRLRRSDLGDLRITTTVNGEVRQDDSTATMKYDIAYQVHYLSTFTTLSPGDLIFTGTPTGAGARFDPPRWLAPGDVVEVSVPDLGTLRNTVADERSGGSPAGFPEPPKPR